MAPKSHQVLLGFAEKCCDINDSKYNIDHFCNLFGGHPIFPSTTPNDQLAYCPNENCKQLLTQICQIYAPLDKSPYHRFLYVFMCLSQSCSQSSTSIRVIRCQYPDEKPVEKQTEDRETISNEISWDTDNSSWDDITDMLNDLSITSQPVRTPPQSNPVHTAIHKPVDLPSSSVWIKMPVLERMWMEIDYEESDCPSKSEETYQHELSLLKEYHSSTSSSSSYDQLDTDVKSRKSKSKGKGKGNGNRLDELEVGWSAETYEKSQWTDKQFKKFQKKVLQNPMQCLRYDRAGYPLLFHSDPHLISTASPTTNNIIGGGSSGTNRDRWKCKQCGGSLIFEFQIMPALISLVPRDQTNRNVLDHFDYGTILVYTCSTNCSSISSSPSGGGGGGGVEYFEETGLIQRDTATLSNRPQQQQ